VTMRIACKLRTLCEVLREIQDEHQDPKAEHDLLVRKRLAEAEVMAKKIMRKLLSYSKKYNKKFFKENPDYEKDLLRRLDTNYLTEEPGGN